jgi:hypothetical protein
MRRIQWLLVDLRRQKRRVAAAAVRLRDDRLALQAAKKQLVVDVFAQSNVLAACFVAGVLLGRPCSDVKPEKQKSARWGIGSVASAAFWLSRMLFEYRRSEAGVEAAGHE